MTDFDFLKDAADANQIKERESYPTYRPKRQAKPAHPGISDHKPTPDKVLLVVDPDTNEVLGELKYPTEFCEGIKCQFSSGVRHDQFSYYHLFNPDGTRRWTHVGCNCPTRTWWHESVTDLVTPLDGKRFPWQLQDIQPDDTTS